ncbi:hypothetical protein CBL31_03970 [Shigella flexneri]|nr:hypothetical protein CBL31_03970 [Shigella flexneri]
MLFCQCYAAAPSTYVIPTCDYYSALHGAPFFSFVCNLNRSPVNIPIIELIIFTLFVFPLTIILFRALSHGNSIVFINF